MNAPPTASILPGLRWIREYRREWLKQDVLAGVTLAAYLLPAGIGDASLANLPPEAGLYACLFSGLVFWLFCSSRHTAITVTSAISLLVGASLGTIAGGDVARYSALAACTALIVAVLAFLGWLLKAGAFVHFISDPVMIGFKAGLALFLASTQLPKLFGFKGSHGDFWERAGHFFSHLGETNMAALTIGLLALAAMVLGKIYLKHKPVALFVVIAGIMAAGLFGLEARGVKMLGTVPQGLPMPGLPHVSWQEVNQLLPLALACFMIGSVETAAIGRMFCAKHGGRFDGNQELLALAGSNLAAGLGRSFPVSGGMSQSLVNENAGAKTPISGLIAALIILVITLFFSGLLHDLPQPVLAAIVLFAVAGLFKVEALKRLWKYYRPEFVVAIAALLGVLGSGLLRGVLIGAVISLIQLLRRASRPHVAFLGRIPDTRRYSDLARHSDNEIVPGILICRPESALYYFNIDHVRDMMVNKARGLSPIPKLVLLDLSAAPYVDLQAAQTLISVHSEVTAMGCQFQVVEARSSVRETLRLEGLEERVGRINRFTSVADAVEQFLSAPVSPDPNQNHQSNP
ncbi:high affinity sulfate transporter 1 [Roseimicrobium gellanilyticum]|uniref:High affinity sulfate transporter 1 n=1 Tax=Roseimicrobium gellanilyticum TaxID=748857 RepID=A0A366H9F5_9BACT|nr:SulP family inorganic anion transporter [Roseimicrobium gellanilyticum]RBP38053.1 high affinity sulfate transporter 1 [Roseimicrobium gellanilyticum]